MENANVTKSLTLGNGDVVSFDTIHYYFSTKRGSEDELVSLITNNELLQQLLVEVDLGISDEEGVAEMIANDPELAGKMKTLTNFKI